MTLTNHDPHYRPHFTHRPIVRVRWRWRRNPYEPGSLSRRGFRIYLFGRVPIFQWSRPAAEGEL